MESGDVYLVVGGIGVNKRLRSFVDSLVSQES